MTYFNVDRIPPRELLPGVKLRAVYQEKAMLTFFDFEPDSVIPVHRHRHEQITYVLEGALEFDLDGETRIVRAGEGVCCPPGVPHGARVLDQPTRALDAWAPLREDYR